ncbi:MFS general substrate transporter [Mytilinidion resinicola]|uniref:MFS general substrate transporter n=1 Tax=Mytilinidion resinicola TaxID=574789 RepID=A0A6A6Y9G0_9PEZI|nr:MFS general substrate transporter [Mytilinidion resinicola]KAF2805269.1 MFS general substrate transporter [Mytilinidion resinicola]
MATNETERDKASASAELHEVTPSSSPPTTIRPVNSPTLPVSTVTPLSTPSTNPNTFRATVLREEDCYQCLAYAYPKSKKWIILTIMGMVQISMNYNAAVFSNAVQPIAKDFNVSEDYVRKGQMIFLLSYAFGCELWAPWSEELGRKNVLQTSLGLVNIWQIMCATSKGVPQILAGRFLGGLSSAGGSVTLGIVADMFEPDRQQYAVAFVVLTSCGGSVVGPVVGGFIQQYLNWRWNFWIQLILGAAVQLIHLIWVPETRSSVLLDREAKKLRKTGIKKVYGPNEGRSWRERFTVREVGKIWARPFVMFCREPIVLCLSLLSGFSDALIFTFLESYGYTFSQWHFSPIQLGLAFIPLLIGYVIAYFMFFPFFKKQQALMMRSGTDALVPEQRLKLLLFLAPLLFIGMFGFAWTATGPPIPWAAPLLISVLIGMANLAVYMATIDYMVAAYGPYASSATGGNGFARDLLAGLSALYAKPLYHNIGPKGLRLQAASTLLGGLAVAVVIPIYIFYWYGPWIRSKSHFAKKVEADRRARMGGPGSLPVVESLGAKVSQT